MGYLDDIVENAKEETIDANEKTFSEIKEMEIKPLEEQTINRTLIKEYGRVKIYKYEGDPLLHYEVPIPKMKGQERRIINTIKTLATKVITKSPDEFSSRKEAWDFYYNKIYEIIKAAAVKLNIPKAKYDFYAEWVTREMIGYGVLDILIDDDLLEEIMVNGPKRPVYVYHRELRMLKTNIIFESDEDIYAIIERIARQIGRRIDIQSPLLDATLRDGSRVNATIPPISIDGCTLTIRKFKKDPFTVLDLIRFGTMNTEVAAFLWLAVEGAGGAKPANILISGGTGSGKTSTLNVLASFIPPTERVITVEDTPELQLPIEHVVRLLTRPPSIEGTGEVTMDMLVKNTLRMRPDRIIVGEVRSKEASTLFTAMNTGHDGALTPEIPVFLSNGDIVKIGNFVENYFMKNKNKIEKYKDYEILDISDENIFVKSMNKENLKLEDKKITKLWRTYKKCQLVNIKTKSGKEITLTEDHPVYILDNSVIEINAQFLKKGDYIALPKKLEVMYEKNEILNETSTLRSKNYLYKYKNKINNDIIFLRNIFEKYAKFNKENCAIEIILSNKNLAEVVPFLLLKYGITSEVIKNKSFVIKIKGKENLEKVLKKIGFKEKILKKDENIEAIPNIDKLISTITKTEYINKSISIEKLKELNKTLKDKRLEILIESDVVWDEIVEIKKINYEGYLYDFTVEDNHTYVAGKYGGFIVSNCMGTLHANNTTETFVRVMSKPMNVPEIMVEALDLVIVQNRINDRRKGTIRRIVEIGELESIIDKKPSTYLLYEWDAYSDTIHRTGMPSKFIQKIMRYTGLSKTDIEDEIENRKKFLEKLLEKEGRMDMKQFKKELNKYEPLFKLK